MKLLILKDKLSNCDKYSIVIPSGMNQWKVSSFLDYIRLGHEKSIDEGYMPKPVNTLHHESLRQLINSPGSTLNSVVTFEQNGHRLQGDDYIKLSEQLNIVLLDRMDEDINYEFSDICLSKSNKSAFASCQTKLISILNSLFGFEKNPIFAKNGKTVISFEELVGFFTEMLDYENQLRFLFRIAELVHSAPFENFSKIFDGIQLHSGCEMWLNLTKGYGGVCSEKTAMLKFICDVLAIHSSPIIGSNSVIPNDFESILREYVKSEGEYELPIWIQHHLLEIEICGDSFLLDVTGGNIPLTFLDKNDSNRLIQNGFRARMVYKVDKLNLARASNWVGDTLLTLSQYHVPDLHMQYIFQQGLGLQISRQVYIGVYFDWGGEHSARMQNHYTSLARKVRFPFPRFIHANNIHCVPDKTLFMLLDKALVSLRNEYKEKNYTGDFTFVIQPLSPHFWTMPRISKSIKKVLWKSFID
jgi:hypothetical protein